MNEIATNTGSVYGCCFFKRILLDKPGWHHIRVDLHKDLTPNQRPTLLEVKGVSLIDVIGPHAKTVYIDDVRLARQ